MDVTLPNGYVIKGVPDGVSKEEIKQKAIAGGYASEADFTSQQRSGMQTIGDVVGTVPLGINAQREALKTMVTGAIAQPISGIPRQLGRTARMTADAVAAFPLAVMDAGTGVRNLYSELSNLNREPLSSDPLKPVYQSYGEHYKENMDKIPWLPPAEGTAEQVVDAIGQIAVGSKLCRICLSRIPRRRVLIC